ncbi:MAG: Uma2 family endonuclease [Geminicoccaceae bacterium]|nr:Uma2 family endonuclease [Geminicoccaceae bacterium]
MAELAVPLIHDADRFIVWETGQKERYEFVGGVVRLMAGGSANHDLISINVAAELRDRLQGSGCRVHGSNLKVRSPAGAVMYPDCFVRCGAHDPRVQVVDDPVIVVEVLSPSTDEYDLTRKRWAYQAIATLHTILFVDTEKARIEQATREPDGSWRSVVHEGLDTAMTIADLPRPLGLDEVYAEAQLDEAGGS